MVIVEIIINGYIGACSDDDGKDDNHGDQTMKKDVLRCEVKSRQQVAKLLNN